MKKKLLFIVLCLVIVGASLSLGGCTPAKELTIVYLGDSIGEAILGPSPMSERGVYGYYSLIGERNSYQYRNRSVSGHQTKDMLKYIKQEDKGATITQTLLKTADIIHISILGNDVLQNNLGEIILDATKENYTKIDNIIAKANTNFAEIVDVLRGYNPTATIFFQNVYNPMFPDSILISEKARTELVKAGVAPAQFRGFIKSMLAKLNGVITNYLAAHPNAFHLIDSEAGFDKIFNEDAQRGESLIFKDGIHPSNEGHAVIADLIQEKLEELQLADSKSALRSYKSLRIDQLDRMFKDIVDVKATRKQINRAKSCTEITKIFFDATRNKVPVYY